MLSTTESLPTLAFAKSENAKYLAIAEPLLAKAEAAGDPALAWPWFRTPDRKIGAWGVSVPDPMHSVPGGQLCEFLCESISNRFPSQLNTLGWVVGVLKTYRVATAEEVANHYKMMERRKQEMLEAELKLRKSRAVSVQPVNRNDFAQPGETLDQLRERVALLREAKKLEGK